MFKKIILTAAAFLVTACAHAQTEGTLLREARLDYYDFFYPTTLSSSRENFMAGDTLKLQSRFVWGGGAPGREIKANQHTVVAFTQEGVEHNLKNKFSQNLWTHGVGALVGEYGLALELWFRDDENGNGFEDDKANAFVWTQEHDRCKRDVLELIKDKQDCLSASASDAAHMTAAPGFKLRAGIAYWVRIKVQRVGATGRGMLHAELLEETGGTVSMVQSAAVEFEIAKHFPMGWQNLEASVARTPGSTDEPYVTWNAFNTGF